MIIETFVFLGGTAMQCIQTYNVQQNVSDRCTRHDVRFNWKPLSIEMVAKCQTQFDKRSIQTISTCPGNHFSAFEKSSWVDRVWSLEVCHQFHFIFDLCCHLSSLIYRWPLVVSTPVLGLHIQTMYCRMSLVVQSTYSYNQSICSFMLD